MTKGSGYFGKLPDRADFVVGNCPEGFLKLWEPFLMRGLACSRLDLGSRWEEVYMTMPVWRFWLAPEEGNVAFVHSIGGAVMPSVDKVGRKFPLTIVAEADPSQKPERSSDDWFEDVEAALLGALDEDANFQGFKHVVSALSDAVGAEKASHSTETNMLKADPGTMGKLTSAFWCRAGRETFAFSCSGLPAEEEFRWLLLPETFEAEKAENELAGQEHGRYHSEDHRT